MNGPAPTTPGTLLVVDDNGDNIDLLRRRLERSGYRVLAAQNGPLALELVRDDPPDLILLDVTMPGMDGLEVLRLLRRDHDATSLPVIMVTARDGTDDIVEALALGANDYVIKPVNFPVLLARVRSQLSRKRAEEGLARAYAELERRVDQRTAELRHANEALQREIAERKAAEVSLSDSESRFRAVVDTAPVQIYLKDREGRYLLVNRLCERFHGRPACEIVGRTGAEVLPAGLAEVFERGDKAALEARRPVEGSFDCETDGETVHLRLISFPIYDGAGTLAAVGAVIADITEMKRNEAALLVAKDEAETATRAKSAFLANMSHELRTPLNAIIGFAELLEGQRLGSLGHPDYGDYAREIVAAGGHLLKIVNDILDLSKIESGMAPLREEETDVREVVRASLAMIAGRAEACGVALEHRVADPAPLLWADPRLLQQMLLNLLSNAVKFTPRDGAVSLEVSPGRDGGCEFRVVDTGVGMEPGQIPLALTRFMQLEDQLVRRYDGTGLGLPLARSFAELHGGTLLLDSRVGQGTTVTVTLPAERVLAVDSAPSHFARPA